MPTRKYRLPWVFLVVVAQAACSRSDRRLENRIDAEVRKGAGTLVRIASLTEFSWERFHVFAPYASQDIIDRELGFAWHAAARTGISDSDAIALLVFVNNGAVVRYVAHPRDKGDFAQVETPGGLSPAEAVFVVHVEAHGRRILQPAQARGSTRRPPLRSYPASERLFLSLAAVAIIRGRRAA